METDEFLNIKANVHSGFLNGAKALLPEIKSQISSSLADNAGIQHVIFTGHSAGGAVITLIFMHMLGILKAECKSSLSAP
jgi:hypothetical protein